MTKQMREMLRQVRALCSRISEILLFACLSFAFKAALAQSLTFGVIGDLPYDRFSINDGGQFKAFGDLLDKIDNDKSLGFLFHVGDIRSGTQPCDQQYNDLIAGKLYAIRIPVIYTPGDNEWADCHKEKAFGGRYNSETRSIDYFVSPTVLSREDPAKVQTVSYQGGHPLANLRALRARFYKPSMLRHADLNVLSQETEPSQQPAFSEFVENRMFLIQDSLFITVNLPGGSNNGTDPWYGAPMAGPEQLAHVKLRNEATQAWLELGFRLAQEKQAKAVILLTQADMWDFDGHPSGSMHLTEFGPILNTLTKLSRSFSRPVLLIHGDSHAYRHDNPLAKDQACFTESLTSDGLIEACEARNRRALSYPNLDPYDNNPEKPPMQLLNFRRLVVHGERLPMEYLKVVVDHSLAERGIGENFFGPFQWIRAK
jgi:hypothetical protein